MGRDMTFNTLDVQEHLPKKEAKALISLMGSYLQRDSSGKLIAYEVEDSYKVLRSLVIKSKTDIQFECYNKYLEVVKKIRGDT